MINVLEITITFIFKKNYGAKGESMSKVLIIAIVICLGIASVGGAYWYIEENKNEEEKNTPPEALITSPYDGQEFDVSKEIIFDASASNDKDGEIVSYDWDFGDGTFGNGVITTHTYQTPGIYTVILTVKDDKDATSSYQISIKIVGEKNNPPKAVIDSPKDGEIFYTTDSIYFDASSSTDPDNDILTYKWISNITGVLKEDSKKFSMSGEELGVGNHRITLEVRDEKGEMDETFINIEVKKAGTNHAPVLEDGNVNPESGTVEDTFVFSVTYKDEDNDEPREVKVKINETEYSMELENGNNYKEGVVYKFEILGEDLGAGEHNFWFIASDGLNSAIGDVEAHTVEVREVEALYAEINASKTDARVGENITFDGSNSSGNIVSWNWSFGDGNFSEDENNTYHRYKRSDNYTVTLRIEDEEGNTKEDSINILIRNKDYKDWSNATLSEVSRQDYLQFPVLSGATVPNLFASWNATKQVGNSGNCEMWAWINSENHSHIWDMNFTIENGESRNSTNVTINVTEDFGENWRMYIRYKNGPITQLVRTEMFVVIRY